MIDGVVVFVNQLRDWYNFIPLLLKALDDAGQGLWSMLGGIVEKNYGAALYFWQHALLNLGSADLLPVEAVIVRYKNNVFGYGLEEQQVQLVHRANTFLLVTIAIR